MKPEMRDMAGLYAVGALSAEEAEAFEAYLETSPEARAEVAEFLATTAQLGEAEAEVPPAALKDRVRADVANTRQEAPVVTALAEHRSRGAIGIGLGNRVDELEAEQAVLTDADAVTVELDGTDGALRVVWSEREGKLAVIGEAPAVADDQTYELWRLSGDRIEAVEPPDFRCRQARGAPRVFPKFLAAGVVDAGRFARHRCAFNHVPL